MCYLNVIEHWAYIKIYSAIFQKNIYSLNNFFKLRDSKTKDFIILKLICKHSRDLKGIDPAKNGRTRDFFFLQKNVQYTFVDQFRNIVGLAEL